MPHLYGPAAWWYLAVPPLTTTAPQPNTPHPGLTKQPPLTRQNLVCKVRNYCEPLMEPSCYELQESMDLAAIQSSGLEQAE
ncbi:MAG: hypothetical protein OJF51_004475 [Nitrospira sp.]|nr:MAG: hypothetical protein OJF51_004475 [Nitrospira sp.]